MHDSQYNLNELVEIKDDFQNKIIKNYDEKLSDEGAAEEEMTNACLLAFTKWCNKFVNEKRDYIALRLPFFDKGDKNLIVWQSEGSLSNSYLNDGSLVQYDPYYDNFELNSLLKKNNVIVLIRQQNTVFRYIIYFTAIIPFDNKYYRYSNYYIYERQLNFKDFKTKNVNKVCEIIGNRIEKYPSKFVDVDGMLDMMWLDTNFIWKFGFTGINRIDEIPLHPSTAPITISKLLIFPEQNIKH